MTSPTVTELSWPMLLKRNSGTVSVTRLNDPPTGSRSAVTETLRITISRITSSFVEPGSSSGDSSSVSRFFSTSL